MLKIMSSSPTCNLVGNSAIRNCSESSWSRSWWQLSSLCFVAHAKSRSRIRDRTHTMPHTMPHTVPAFTCSHMRPQPCTHHTMPHTIHAFTYMFIHAIPTHSVCFFLLWASVMAPMQALPARAQCRDPAALGDVLLKEANQHGKLLALRD